MRVALLADDGPCPAAASGDGYGSDGKGGCAPCTLESCDSCAEDFKTCDYCGEATGCVLGGGPA